jgi:branched-chain amino acid transport system substrate-binding protein
VNHAGGIHGSKVELIVKDVGSTASAEGLTAVEDLIGQDHVIAIISDDVNQSVWLPYASDHGVPVIVAGVGNTVGADIFQTQESIVGSVYSEVAMSKSAGANFGLGYCAESPSCAVGPVLKLFAKDVGGVNISVVGEVAADATDYTAFCQQLKEAKVDSYYLATANSVISRIVTQCAGQGVKAVPLLAGSNGEASWLTDPVYQGALVNDAYEPFFDTAIPAIKAYRDAIAKYASSIKGSAANSENPLFAWVAGQVVWMAAEKVGGTITSASLKKALYGFKNETFGGLTAPVTFNQAGPSLPTCFFEWKIEHGKRVNLNDSKPRCGPDSAVAPFIQKVG